MIQEGSLDKNLSIIPFGDGRYAVSKSGVVINTRTGRQLKRNKIKGGYHQINLCHKNQNKKFLVHRLVAIAFLPNPLGLPEVNHLDKNPSNNNVLNLEWCTSSGNVKHSYDTGRVPLRGSRHGKSKLDELQVLTVKNLLHDLSSKQIASYFRVDPATITDIRMQRTWSHI